MSEASAAARCDAAARTGAEIRTGVTVSRLERTGDQVRGVVANGEAIETGEVVLATNAWTPRLLPELPQGAIVPARGQILVTSATTGMGLGDDGLCRALALGVTPEPQDAAPEPGA